MQQCVIQRLLVESTELNATIFSVPLRLLTWISQSTSALEVLTNKGTMDR